ncbi:transcription factor Pdr3p [Monosporozyma servazzii]
MSSETSPTENKNDKLAVKKRKINKACANCRRKKIKCTGSRPCANCVSYKCVCEFTPRRIRNTGNKKVTSPDTSDGVHSTSVFSSDSEVQEPLTTKPVLGKFSTTKLSFKDNLLDPKYNRNSVSSTNVGSLNTVGNKGITRRDSYDCRRSYSLIRTPTFTTTSDRSHRKRNRQTLPQTYEQSGVYGNDVEQQDEYIKLTTTLAQLKSLNDATDLIKQMIIETENQLIEFTKKWKPSIDFQKIPVDNNGKSVESMLMKNKYRDQIFLGRFASLRPSDKKYTATITTDQTFMAAIPLVDELFGLYSPFDALSFRGLGCLIQKYTTSIQNYGAAPEEKLKATVYIMLRFLDICCVHSRNSVASMANPLENYFRRTNYNKTSLGSNITTHSPLPSITSTHGINNKELVARIIKQIPESFTKELTMTSIDDLLKLLNQDFEMFKTLLKIYKLHKDIFEMKTMQLSKKNYFPDNNEIYSSFKLLIEYCKLQDILLALCYSYYNSTLYHLDECNSLDYLEALLLFLDHQEWSSQGYGYEKVLSVVTDCTFGMGLNRWEFYVGVDEFTANRRRKAWWKVYCLEKYFSFRMGRQSIIDDTKVNCLLPEPMRRLGFVDLRDFIDRVDTFKPDQSIFDSMSIEDSKIYGICASTIIISHFYSNVLYSDEYTSIKIVAMPQFIRERYLCEIFDKCESIRKKLKIVEKQMDKLFLCARTPREVETAVPGDDKYKSSDFVISYYFYSSIFLKSSFTLISRLTGFPVNPRTNKKIREYSKEIYEIFCRCSDILLTLDTSYEIWRQFRLYSLMFVMISFYMDNKNFFVKVEDIIKVFRIFKRILTFAGHLEEFRLLDPHVSQNQTLQEFERNLTLLTILIRVLVLDFMLRSDIIKVEDIITLVKSTQHGDEVAHMIVLFVDHKSYLFNFVLQPIQPSAFHLNVQQLLENIYALSFPKDVGNSSLSIANLRYKNGTKFIPGDYHQNGNRDTSYKPALPVSVSMDCSQERLEAYKTPGSKDLDSIAIPIPNSTSAPSVSGSINSQDMQINGVINGNSTPYSAMKPERSTHGNNTAEQDQPHLEEGNSFFNMGTVEDFVNNTDLNDLYKSLWNDNFHEIV